MQKKKLVILGICTLLLFLLASQYFFWGGKKIEEIEIERIAVDLIRETERGNDKAIRTDELTVPEKLALNLMRETERGNYKIVRADELKQWLDHKKDMLIMDTRGPFQKSYISAATPFGFPQQELNELMDYPNNPVKSDFVAILGPDKNRLLVFYSASTTCTRSHNGAKWAAKLGYKNVYRFPGGIKAWEEAGFPTIKERK